MRGQNKKGIPPTLSPFASEKRLHLCKARSLRACCGSRLACLAASPAFACALPAAGGAWLCPFPNFSYWAKICLSAAQRKPLAYNNDVLFRSAKRTAELSQFCLCLRLDQIGYFMRLTNHSTLVIAKQKKASFRRSLRSLPKGELAVPPKLLTFCFASRKEPLNYRGSSIASARPHRIFHAPLAKRCFASHKQVLAKRIYS